jgi:hypothetical protein
MVITDRDQNLADGYEGVRLVTFLLRTDRCVALHGGRLCGAKGGPICPRCRSSFGRGTDPTRDHLRDLDREFKSENR